MQSSNLILSHFYPSRGVQLPQHNLHRAIVFEVTNHCLGSAIRVALKFDYDRLA
mgnify:CR=1 FL=1